MPCSVLGYCCSLQLAVCTWKGGGVPEQRHGAKYKILKMEIKIILSQGITLTSLLPCKEAEEIFGISVSSTETIFYDLGKMIHSVLVTYRT